MTEEMNASVGAPAFCAACKIMFDSGLISGVVIGCTAKCPKCRQTVPIIDAIYDDDVSEMKLTFPSRAIAIKFEELKALARKLNDERNIQPHEILAEIVEINPELAAKLYPFAVNRIWLIIAFLLILIRSIELDISIDINRTIDQLNDWGEERTKTEIERPEETVRALKLIETKPVTLATPKDAKAVFGESPEEKR